MTNVAACSARNGRAMLPLAAGLTAMLVWLRRLPHNKAVILAEREMDEAQRVPIDLPTELAPSEAAGAGRLTRQPDGSWVIDIMVPQPCGVPAAGEILVCVPTVDSVRYPTGLAPPPRPTLSDKLTEVLTTRIGPVEVGPIDGAMQLRVRF
jgi:hypothetical protein